LSESTYDVFISHSQEDRPWVYSELLSRLEGAGLRVLLADRDFAVGTPTTVNAERAIEESDHTLIVLTPEWIASEWNEFEGLLASASDPAGRRRKLIPLMLKPCKLPPRISMLTYANLTVAETRRWQWDRVIRALKGGSSQDGAPALADDPSGDPIFVNRDRELDLLNVERLRGAQSPYTLIDAPAGYGKTCLLRQVLRVTAASADVAPRWSPRYVEFYPSGSEDGEQETIATLATALGGEAEPGDAEALLASVCTYVTQELTAPLAQERGPGRAEERRAALILLDGVEQLDVRARQWLYDLFCRCHQRTRSRGRELVVVRFVLSGRNAARFWEEYALRSPIPVPPQRIHLSPLDRYAIEEWVWKQAQAVQIVLDESTVRRIAGHVGYLSGGHPRVIRGLMDDLVGQLFMIGPADRYYGERREALLQACLAPVADELLCALSDKLQNPVRALSIFRRVNANTLQALKRAEELCEEVDEVVLLGDLQRARVLEGPRIDEPFYRDRLLRPVLARNMAYRDEETRAQFQALNRVALDLYAGWVQDGDRALPDSHLKATQRLYAVIEWLYHALQDEAMDEGALQAGLQAHITALARGDAPRAVAALIVDALDRDAEVRYLLQSRLGEDGVERAKQWLEYPYGQV
jgi:hypothetical protein